MLHKTCFSFYGEIFELHTNAPALCESICGFLNFEENKTAISGTEKKSNLPQIHIMADDDQAAFFSTNVSRIMNKLFIDLSACFGARFLFLHACAVIHKGRATVFCGKSMSGKTTLAILSHCLGYKCAGEDIIAVDHRAGMIYPLYLPYSPRPFTRELLYRLFRDSADFTLPFAPSRPQAPAVLERLYLPQSDLAFTDILVRSSYHAPETSPETLALRISHMLRKCKIFHVPGIHIDKNSSLDDLKKDFEVWLNQDIPAKRDFIPRIFKKRP